MKTFSILSCIGLLTGLLALPSSLAAQEAERAPKPKYESTKHTLDVVGRAVELVRSQGAGAFPKFRDKSGEWFHEDEYVFVFDSQGVCLCHPVSPELEGQPLPTTKDADGKPIAEHMLRQASKNGSGWNHYRWPRGSDPGGEPVWKSSFVMLVKDVKGADYIVGSGFYGGKTERLFVFETVNEAAELVAKKGKKAFPMLSDMAGFFRYRDVYVFVHDKNGIEHVNPAFPENEGQNILDLKDANGKLMVRDSIAMLETKDSGWIDYMWPKPGETEPSRKSSFVRRVNVGDESFYVGAGIYMAPPDTPGQL